MNEKLLLENLRNIPDFPKPGIQFKDVSTLFKNPACNEEMLNELVRLYQDKGITKVVGIESRGFKCIWHHYMEKKTVFLTNFLCYNEIG